MLNAGIAWSQEFCWRTWSASCSPSGPFDHVVVSALQVLFGVWHSDAMGYADVWRNVGLSTIGTLAGGLLLITLTHTAQVKNR